MTPDSNRADPNPFTGIAFSTDRPELQSIIAAAIGSSQDQEILSDFRSILSSSENDRSPMSSGNCGCAIPCSGCSCGCSSAASSPLSFDGTSEFNPNSQWQSPNFFDG